MLVMKSVTVMVSLLIDSISLAAQTAFFFYILGKGLVK